MIIDPSPSSAAAPPSSTRRRWPWIVLLVLSATYWLFALTTDLELSPANVPVWSQAVVAAAWPIGLLGLGRGRWPWPVMWGIVLLQLVLGWMAFMATAFASGGEVSRIPPRTIDGRTVQLLEEENCFFFSCCYALKVELVTGWLWQPLEHRVCVDHGYSYAGSHNPGSAAVEPGPVPKTVAITADVDADDQTTTARKRLGLYRIGFAGRLIRVAPSPPAP